MFSFLEGFGRVKGRHRASGSPGRGKSRVAVLFSLISVGVLVGAVAAFASHVDLTNPLLPDDTPYDSTRSVTVNSYLMSDGSIVEYIDPVGSTGSGVFDAFVRIQASGNETSEKGYNTDGTPEFDSKGGTFTHSVLLSDIPQLKIGSLVYREFVTDLNEGNADGDEFITFDAIQIYLVTDPTIDDYTLLGTPEWVMPESVNMVDYQSGSGDGDVRLLVKNDEFDTGAEDCGYGSTTCTTYLVFYAEHGFVDGDPINGEVNGGFEEWGVLARPKLNVVKTGAGLITPSVADWLITKTPNGAYTEFAGDGGSHDFDISVEPVLGEDSVTVQGTIIISNTGDVDAIITEINDVFQTQTALLTCPDIQAGEFSAGVLSAPYTLGDGDSLTCTYVIADPTGVDGDFNVAEVIADDPIAASGADDQVLSASAQVEILFADSDAVGITQVDVIDDNGTPADTADDVTLDSLDYNEGDVGSHLYDWDYAYTCPTNADLYTNGHLALDDYVNTARVAAGADLINEDSATVEVDCYVPVVEKDAAGAYGLTHTWEITKTDDGDYSLFAGESVDHPYDISVRETETAGEGTVSGSVSVENPNPDDVMSVTVTDMLSDGTVVTLTDCVDSTATAVPSAGDVYDIPAGETMTCDYSATDPELDATSNTATAVLNDVSVSDIALFDYVLTPLGPTSVDVTDDNEQDGIETLGTTFGDADYDTTSTYTCPIETGKYDADGWYELIVNNTAYAKDGDTIIDQDSAIVTVDCYVPVVEKDAVGAYGLTHTWEITKTDDGDYSLFAGESVDHPYDISVDETETAGEGTVSGSVSVENPNPDDVMSVTVTDMLSDGTVVTLTDCVDSTATAVPSAGDVYDIPAGETMTCDYSATDPELDATSNTATAVLNDVSVSDIALFDYVLTPLGPTSVDVTDDNEQDGIETLGTTSGDAEYDTTSTYTCPIETGKYDADGWYELIVNNTAYAKDGDTIIDQDSARVTVDCYILTAVKEVTPSFTRTYDYTVDKEAMYYADPQNTGSRTVIPDGTELNLMFGQSYWLEWDIVVGGNGYVDTDHQIDTDVTVYNSSPDDATGVDIVDTTVGLSCLNVTVPGALAGVPGEYPCEMDDFATDTTLTTNTADVKRGLVTHAQPSDTWNWDTPTDLVNELVDVQDLFDVDGDLVTEADLSNQLTPPPATVAWSEVDGVDETKTFTLHTSLSSDLGHQPDRLLVCGPNEIVNSVNILGETDTLASDTDRVIVNVMCNDTCTLTQGYWKTHSAAGPKGYHDDYEANAGDWKHRDDTWDSIDEDSFFFLSGEKYWMVQWHAPQGDKYYNLAHQYIAAQLNIQANANELGISFDAALLTAPADVQAAYAGATQYFQVTPPGEKLKGKAAKHLTAWAGTFAAFNEGDFAGWPHCDDVPESVQAFNARLNF